MHTASSKHESADELRENGEGLSVGTGVPDGPKKIIKNKTWLYG